MNALELQGLTKHYKDFTLGPLDLTLPGGTICGLIGENGAGKSTTIRLILDMVQRDGGTVTILGRDSRTVSVRTKEEIGVVLGSEGIPLCLNAVQAGKVMAGIYRIEFGGLLGYAPIMPVNQFDCSAFVNRQGRIPAPIHSFKN